MEEQHRSKLQKLENQTLALKEQNRGLERAQQVEVNALTLTMSAEIDKERNIASIMVEEADEEKARLQVEMEALREEFEEKGAAQKEQIEVLRRKKQNGKSSVE